MTNATEYILNFLETSTDKFDIETSCAQLENIPDDVLERVFDLVQDTIDAFYDTPDLPTTLMNLESYIACLLGYEIARRQCAEEKEG